MKATIDDPPKASASIADVPSEVVLERLLPLLALKDIGSLACVNKYFHNLTSDETLWSHLTIRDFHLSPHTLAPPPTTSQFSKTVYLGLTFPRAFVWGSSDNHRLGTSRLDPDLPVGTSRFRRYVDRPVELSGAFRELTPEGQKGRSWTELLRSSLAAGAGGMSGGDPAGSEGGAGRGLVDLQASGWGFTARDMDGGVWVWGQLDGSILAVSAMSWENKNYVCPEPYRIPLPCQAIAISAGRMHLLVLDSDNLIWELKAWGKAYHHTAACLTSPTTPGATGRTHHVVQVSAGWSHSACLDSSGRIHIWYPFSRTYETSLSADSELAGPLGADGPVAGRAVRWGTVADQAVETLEPLPKRPVHTAEDDWTDIGTHNEEETGDLRRTRTGLENEWAAWQSSRTTKTIEDRDRVTKIASGLGFVVALKGNGEVWYRRLQEERQHEWEYLPWFSGPAVTHLTAQFSTLTSYTTSASPSLPSALFHARLPDSPQPHFGADFQPTPLPALQGKNVIQVALGDYHYAALTSKGEMYTWGQCDFGQLGLTKTVRIVEEPEQVRFGKEPAFVFNITAAGFHTGALTLGDPMKSKRTSETTDDGEAVIGSTEVEGGREENIKGSMPGAFPTTTTTNDTRRRSAADYGVDEADLDDFRLRGVRMGNHAAVGMSAFRVGFAGRGRGVGGNPQRGIGRGGLGPGGE